ncbi:DUF2956 domain-containing protein [Photobacterium aphoticum]|nr:DUF2956 domain-containing protein [Photobacterium aphoticum]GHA47131.1 membrane protein [Photobacterium aphoticum]
MATLFMATKFMATKKVHSTPSPETQTEAMKIARATQKPGQTKEQTKLIAQGIQHGIELYKKQQKAKSRERDKLRKKQIKDKQTDTDEVTTATAPAHDHAPARQQWLPWVLLALSWVGFIAYTQL